MRKFILEGKTHQIRSQLQSGADDYTSVPIAPAELFQNGLIEYDDGLVYADNDAFYQESTKPARAAALK